MGLGINQINPAASFVHRQGGVANAHRPVNPRTEGRKEKKGRAKANKRLLRNASVMIPTSILRGWQGVVNRDCGDYLWDEVG